MQCRNTILGLGLLALALVPLLLAQSETGSMMGTITDPSGAAVPGAEVVVRNTGTSVTFVSVTDATGIWRAPQLVPGVYEISVSAKGFSTMVRRDINVRVADRLRVDFTLQVGALAETIAVTGTAPLLQVEDAALGQVVDNKNIVELPLNGRNWLQLATLAPATVVTTPGAAAGSLSLGINIGGLSSNQTQFLLDGADNTNLIAAGAAFSPPVDALQEFKVQSNNFTADAAGYSGAVLNAAVKSGTNEYHGNAYEFFRNNVLNARNFFA
ncbi:MAG: carboxypeptidase regulatory-like domain-containing protein, partial [Bryobacteraceae bacterium]